MTMMQRMRRLAAAVILLAATVPGAASAQVAGPTLRPPPLPGVDTVLAALPLGAYVRALDFAIGDGVNGVVQSRSREMLSLRLDDGRTHDVFAENVRSLRIRGERSRRYGYRTGVTDGAAIGVLAGVLVHFAGEWFLDAPFADAGPQVVIFTTGLSGAAIGGVVGAMVGRYRWTQVL